ncbi:50S ribosome-binding GTPase [Alkalicella caledoniensis]|uniref:50S ribosome-binding GTPase n=1 Tax=Alkalicella caledoniensis TaxID=2731377 RepID=A0A7G9WCV6_ALKCA|nr:GTPase [Alkalicella caledoniensis]QNO16518.1 50S ribosome-binding GTPase [Alkalicella caledoniensis]
MKILIVGKPNVGKTMFVLQMAKLYKVENLIFTLIHHNGHKYKKKMDISEGFRTLVSEKANHTLNIHEFILPIKKGKGNVEITLLDSCGLLPIIHHVDEVREGMAQTLQHFKQATAVFHIIDSSSYVTDNLIDQEIYEFGLQQDNYLILANKIDLDSGQFSIPRVRNDYSQAIVVPISAKTGEGLQEVTKYVARLV